MLVVQNYWPYAVRMRNLGKGASPLLLVSAICQSLECNSFDRGHGRLPSSQEIADPRTVGFEHWQQLL